MADPKTASGESWRDWMLPIPIWLAAIITTVVVLVGFVAYAVAAFASAVWLASLVEPSWLGLCIILVTLGTFIMAPFLAGAMYAEDAEDRKRRAERGW